jgi:methylenetetrahydrofolate dehydrogenase (NADP+)/methenyltetrahydrofolate cyclohydrolase
MILDGRKVSEKRLDLIRECIDESGLYPKLATIMVGDDPASKLYVRMKHQACEKVHIGPIAISLPADATTTQVLSSIHRLNRDPDIHGILVQLPLPAQVSAAAVLEAVDPAKDVDGFHPCNLGRLMSGNPVFVPCTPKGIMTLLEEYHIGIEKKDAVVVGRSIEVGRPMAALLLNADATVTICHRRTKDLKEKLLHADIIVTAVGKPHFIGPEMVRPGTVVIDVGINYVDGKLCGDASFDALKEIAGAITPVPGGVGPMTIASLMENTYLAASRKPCTPV